MQAMGVVHGGAIVSLADTAAGFGCACSLGGAKLTTVELKANFIGSAFAGDLLMAKAWCVHSGRSTHVWDAEVSVDDRPLALFRATQLILSNT